MFAGACRLDRRIEREQVRLTRDSRNGLDEITNAL